jgi:hypothetical protein
MRASFPRRSVKSMSTTADITEVREQALERLKKKQDFKGHLLVFAMVNALVWTTWALTGSGFPWPVFVTGGWSVGVVMNAWDVYWRRPITEADLHREIEHLNAR